MLHAEPKEFAGQLAALTKHYAKTLGLSSAAIQSATGVARTKLIEMAGAMEISVVPGSAAAKLLKLPNDDNRAAERNQAVQAQDTLAPMALQATQAVRLPNDKAAAPESQFVAQTLAAGIQDITNSMVEDFKLTDVLRMILETMYRAMSFHRVIFCMRDPKTDTLTGRFGLGEGVDGVVKSFRIPLNGAVQNLFSVVCLKGADTMISDASESHIANHLPPWYLESLNAPTFLLLPLLIKGRPFGLIYADKIDQGGLALDEKELSLLRTLRNQAVMAFKQAG